MSTNNNPNSHLSLSIPLNLLEECFHVTLNAISANHVDNNTTIIHPLFLFLWNEFCKNTESICHDLLLNISDHSYWRDVILVASLNPVSERWEQNAKMLVHASKMSYPIHHIIDALLIWRENHSSHSSTNKSTTKTYTFSSQTQQILGNLKESMLYDIIILRILLLFCESLEPDQLTSILFAKIANIVIPIIARSADEQLYIKFPFVPSLYLSSKILATLSAIHFQSTIEAIFQQLSAIRSQPPLSTLLILSLRYIQLKVYPLECLDQTSYSLYQCCKYFDQQSSNKLDWAILLNHWIIRLIPSIHAEMNIPSISKPIDQLREKALKYASKAKTVPESLELVSTLLCITKRDVFMKQFSTTIDGLLSKIIKDKSTLVRQTAFISLSRLIWVYLYLHSQSSYSEVTSSLLSIIKKLYISNDQQTPMKRIVFYPSDLPNYFHIRLLGIIGYKCIELVCSEVGFPFLSSSLQFDTLFKIPLWISNIYEFVEQWFTINHQHNGLATPLTTILQRDWQCFEYSHMILCSFLYSLHSNVSVSLPPFPLESPIVSPDYSYWNKHECTTMPYLDSEKEWHDIGLFAQAINTIEFLTKYENYFNNCPFTRQQSVDKCIRSLTELAIPLDKLLPALIESSFEEKLFSFLYQGTPGIQILQQRGSTVFKSMAIIDTLFGPPRHYHDRKGSTYSLETQRLAPSETLVSSTLKSSFLLPITDTIKITRTITSTSDISPSTHPIIEGTLEWISNVVSIIPLVLYHYNLISRSSFHPMALSPTSQDSQIQLPRSKKLMLIKIVLLGCAFPSSSLVHQKSKISLKCIIDMSQDYIPEILTILDDWIEQSSFFVAIERKSTVLDVYILTLSIISPEFLKSDIKYTNQLLYRYLDLLFSPFIIRKYALILSKYLEIVSLDPFSNILDDSIEYNNKHISISQCILENDDTFWCKTLLPWILRKYISIMDQYEVLQSALMSLSKVALYRLIEGLNKLANQNGIFPNKVKLFLSTRTTDDASIISWRDSHSKMQKQDILIQLETDMIVSTILSSRILTSIIPEIFISFFQFYYVKGTQGMLFYSIEQTDGSHNHTNATSILGGTPSNVSYNQLYSDIDFPNLYFVIPSQMRKRFFEYLSWIHPKWIKTFLHEWCYGFHLIGVLSVHSDSSTLLKTSSFITNSPMILMICDWINLLIKYIESNESCTSFLLPALSSIISILQHVESHNRWETIQLKNHFNTIVHCILEHPTSTILVQSRPDLISKFFQYFLDHMCKPIIFAPGTKELSGTKEQRIMIIQHFDRTSQKMDEIVLECLILLTRYHEIIKNHSIQGTLMLKHPLRKTWTLPVLLESENRKSSISTSQQSITSSNQSFNTTEEEFLGLFSWMDQLWSSWIIPLLFRQPYSGIRALSNYLAFSSHFPYDYQSWSELLYIIWSMIRELKDSLIPDRQYSIDLLHNILVSICNAFQWNLEQLDLYTLGPITDIKYCWLNHHHFVNRSTNVLLIRWIISWWHLFRSIRNASKNYSSIRILLDVSQQGLRLLSELFIKLCESDMIIPIHSIFSNTNTMNELTLEKVLSSNTIPSCLSTIFSLLYISESCKWVQYDNNSNQFYYNIDWNSIFEAVKSALNNPISLLPFIRHILYLSIATMSPWYLYNSNDTFDVIYNNMPKHAQQLSKQVVDVWKYIFDNRSEHRIALLQFLLHHGLSDGPKNTILCILLTYLHIYEDVRLSFQRDLLIISLKDPRNIETLAMDEHLYCTCCYPWDGNEPGLSYLNNILTKPEIMSYPNLSLNWLLISFIMWPDISLLSPDFIFCILHPKSTIPSSILSCTMRRMLDNPDVPLSVNNLVNSTVMILNRYDNPINPFLSYGLFCSCMSVLLNETHIKMIHLDILLILDGLLIYIIDKNHTQRTVEYISFLFKHSFSFLLLEYQSIDANSLIPQALSLYQAILERSISVLLRDADVCNIVIEYGYEWFWSIIGKNNDRDCMIDIILISLLKSVLKSDNPLIYSEIFHNKKILSLPFYCILGYNRPEWIELLIELMRFFKNVDVDSKSNTQIVLIIIGISIISHYKWEGKNIDNRLVEELERLDINNFASSFINADSRDDALIFQFVNTFRKIIRSSPSFVGSRDHDLLLCILFARYHIMDQNNEIGHQIFKSILSNVMQGDLPGSPISIKQGHTLKNTMTPRIEGLCYFILRHLLDNKDQSCLEYLYMMNEISIQDRDNIDASRKSIYVILYNQLRGSVYSNDSNEIQFIGLLKRRVEYPWES